MKEKANSYHDWIFANEAGYIGKYFFCFSQNSCSKLIHYQDLTKISLTKKIPVALIIFFYSILLMLFFCFFMGYFKTAIVLVSMQLALYFLYLKISWLQSAFIVITLRNNQIESIRIPRKHLDSHLELVLMVKKIIKNQSKEGTEELLFMRPF